MTGVLSGLSPKQIREARRQVYADNQSYPRHLVPVSKEKWPPYRGDGRAVPIGVWRSRDFLLMIFSEGAHVRLSVNRTDITPEGEFLQDISWDDLQRLKREAGYGDCDAVEVYPANIDVVNVANMRHLWILNPDDKLPVIWRKKK